MSAQDKKDINLKDAIPGGYYASNGDVDINGFGHYILKKIVGQYQFIACDREQLGEDDGTPGYIPEFGDVYTFRCLDKPIEFDILVSDNSYDIHMRVDGSERQFSAYPRSAGSINGHLQTLLLECEEEILALQASDLIAAHEMNVSAKPRAKL